MALTFPANPTNGQIYDQYIYDAITESWRVYGSDTGFGQIVPTGCIMMWYTNMPPLGWIFCDGQSTSPYPELAAVVGANVPNLKGRVPVGLDSAQSEFDALGETGGAKTHTLTTSEMPAHSHELRSNSHTGGAIEDRAVAFNRGYPANGLGTPAWVVNVDAERLIPFGQGYVSSSGGGTAHNNLQPYVVVRYIIKT
jgi:microcystin-dependent protein